MTASQVSAGLENPHYVNKSHQFHSLGSMSQSESQASGVNDSDIQNRLKSKKMHLVEA